MIINCRSEQIVALTMMLGLSSLWVLEPGFVIGQTVSSEITNQVDKLAEAKQLDMQAFQLYKQGKYSEAIPLLKRVLDTRRAVLGEESADVATCLNNLAEAYRAQGNYKEAEPLHLQALSLRKRLFLLGGKNLDVAQSLNNVALLYVDQGRDREAEPLFLQAIKISEDLNEKYFLAISLNSLASLYLKQGNLEKAEKLMLRSLELRKKLLGENDLQVIKLINNLGVVYLEQRRYEKAEEFLSKALKMEQMLLGNHPYVANSHDNLGDLYKILGKYKEAEANYLEALRIREEIFGNRHPSIEDSFNKLASFYWMQSKFTDAVSFHTKALELEEYYLSLNLSGGFERQKRDYLGTYFRSTNNAISIHLNAAPNSPQAARLAFTSILRRKGRILDLLTNNQRILQQQRDPRIKVLRASLSKIQNQISTLIFSRPENITLEQYRQRVSSLENEAKQVEDQLSRHSTGYPTQSETVTIEAVQQLIPPSTALIEIVKYYPWYPKSRLISTLTYNGRPWHVPELDYDPPRYAAYILFSKGDPQGINLSESKAIEKKIQLLRLSLQDAVTYAVNLKEDTDDFDLKSNLFRRSLQKEEVSVSEVKKSARSLDQILMQPIRKLLGNTHNILLSPDSDLNLIPFEALVDENNQYLIENYSFTYLTSGRDLLRLKSTSPIGSLPLIVADPLFERGGELVATQPNISRSILGEIRSVNISQMQFSPIPHTADEARAISKLLKVKPLLGSQATEKVIKQTVSPKILHIATHGFFVNSAQNELDQATFSDNPLLLSGLVLAGVKVGQSGGGEDGVLTALEITGLNLQGTKLAALSACDTGVGNFVFGEGIYNLRRALVISGAESQLISLWKVNDQATKDLMVSYYKKLLSGEGRSEALRQAKLETIFHEQYSHPYFWAGFILSGNWSPLETPLHK
ncbi:MAG: hypothetical protein B0A82_11440 [Alkalinema sp. CACIAM 70d]|nr:MAG: hypothetical protein B0A82_11440 [Alkalinema sp. CACIAM 70d]